MRRIIQVCSDSLSEWMALRVHTMWCPGVSCRCGRQEQPLRNGSCLCAESNKVWSTNTSRPVGDWVYEESGQPRTCTVSELNWACQVSLIADLTINTIVLNVIACASRMRRWAAEIISFYIAAMSHHHLVSTKTTLITATPPQYKTLLF